MVSADKLRGGLYTPPPLVHHVVDRLTALLNSRTGVRLPEGNACKWFASRTPRFHEGDIVTFVGTVKAHDEYRGVKSTTFTRCKVESS